MAPVSTYGRGVNIDTLCRQQEDGGASSLGTPVQVR